MVSHQIKSRPLVMVKKNQSSMDQMKGHGRKTEGPWLKLSKKFEKIFFN